jgi:hypothetical protein
MRALSRFVVVIAFAFWVGGFFFYSGVAVAVGTKVLGSSTSQGFITQQVTWWMNVSAVVALAIFLGNVATARRTSARNHLRTLAATWLLMACLQAGLFALHPVLDRMLIPAEERVLTHARFYRLHGVYLDLISVQQFTAILHLWVAMALWRREDVARATSRLPARDSVRAEDMGW